MIRLATHLDTKIILDLLEQFLQDTSYSQAVAASKNQEHLCKMIWTAQQYGYIWLGFVNDEPVGLLIAIKEPNAWFPQAIQFRELVWYVMPEHRHSSIGGKLFLKYCEKAEELKEKGLIQGYFTTRMSTSDSINLERRGFRLTESTYIKE
jgi:L-amino acid N-acyltransferase YncA